MAFQGLVNILSDFLRFLNIETSTESQGSLLFGESFVSQRADIAPEGSSVDPEPVVTESKADSTDSNVTSPEECSASEGNGECEQASDEFHEAFAADNALPKSPFCSDALSRDLFIAVRDDSAKDECSEAVFSESERETETEELVKCPHQSVAIGRGFSDTTSQCTEEEDNAACEEAEKEAAESEDNGHSDVKNAAEQVDAESELLVSAIPSTDYDGSPCTDVQEECILHRITPKLSASRVNSAAQRPQRTRGKVTFNSPLFSEGDFELRIIHEKVCLEFVLIDATEIHGYVRVLNTTYVKDVTVHYTKNNWKIVRSRKARWVETVSDGTMDRFVFTIPGRQSVGHLLFSVEFNGILDNNKGRFYTIAYEAA